jgi:predicted RNase H-like nuclease
MFLFLQVVSYIKPDLRLFQAMAHLMSSPLCSHILKPKTQDFCLSNITNQDFVPYIKQVRNVCSNNMMDFCDERSKMKASATVHWNGKFTPLGATLNLPR